MNVADWEDVCHFLTLFFPFNLGAGKTWPCICLPQDLDILRDEFNYNIQKDTRILYIVSLVNIYHSLEMEIIMNSKWSYLYLKLAKKNLQLKIFKNILVEQ